MDWEELIIFNMLINFRHKWFIARLIIILLNINTIREISQQVSNQEVSLLDWGIVFLISIVIMFFLFAWLTAAVYFKPDIDWSDPYSWEKPFWPMMKYPLRFIFLTVCILIFMAIVALIIASVSQNGQEALGGTVFFMGVFLLFALKVWLKIYGHKIQNCQQFQSK